MQRDILAGSRSIGLAVLLAASGAAQAGGNVVGAIGVRSLSDDQFEDDFLDGESQLAFGVAADFGLGDIPLYLATRLAVSVGDGAEGFDSAAVADLSIGLKLMPAQGSFRPYFGAGFSSVSAVVEVDDDEFFSDDTEDDQSFGFYASGGALFVVNKHFTVGVDVRYIGGTDIDLFGFEYDADSVTGTILIGYSWGN